MATAQPPPIAPPPGRRAKVQLLLLLLILLLAAGLRIHNLSALGYWTDEFITLINAHGWGVEINRLPLNQFVPARAAPSRLDQARPWSQIVPGMVRDDSHPPLYIFLVRGWEALSGNDSEIVVRSIGVACSLMAIVLLYMIAGELNGATVARWACMLMAVAAPQIAFAQDAGKFMPLMMLTLLAAWSLARLRRSVSVGWAALVGASMLAMMLTHYFAAGAAVGLGLYALLTLRGRARTHAIGAFVAAAVLFCVLWGPSFLGQRSNFTANYSWVTDAGPGHAQRVALDLLRLPARLIVEMNSSGWQNAVAVAFGLLFLLLLPLVFVKRPNLRLFVLWFTFSVGLLVCLDLTRSTLQLRMTRYTLVAAPALYTLIAAAVPARWGRNALPALAVAIALVRLPAAYLPPWKIDFRTPVQIVSSKLQPGDGLVLASTDRAMVVVTYTAFQHYAGASMPSTVATLTQPADAPVLVRLAKCQRIWVMWMDERERIHDWLPGLRIEEAGRLTQSQMIVVGTLAEKSPLPAPPVDQR